MPKKVKIVQVALAERCVCQGEERPHSHLAGVDAQGRLWERTSDMPLGQWGEVERPDEPVASRKWRSTK